jgi:hypothetical protein
LFQGDHTVLVQSTLVLWSFGSSRFHLFRGS